MEREILWSHDAVTRHIHHAVAEGSTGKDTYGGYKNNRPETRYTRSNGRIKKVYGVVADTNYKVEHRKDDEEDHNA